MARSVRHVEILGLLGFLLPSFHVFSLVGMFVVFGICPVPIDVAMSTPVKVPNKLDAQLIEVLLCRFPTKPSARRNIIKQMTGLHQRSPLGEAGKNDVVLLS
jgi:hypothetical protein